MKKQLLIHLILVLVLGLGLGGGKVLAQTTLPQEIKLATTIDIPIQGRLLTAGGVPVDGELEVGFRLYSAASAGTLYCEDYHAITVADGLYSTTITCGRQYLDGRDLYLAVKIEGDDEMTPRQKILPVAYAASFLPGAFVYESTGTGPALALAGSNPGLPGVLYAQNGDAEGIAAWFDNASASEAPLVTRNVDADGPLFTGFSGSDADYDFQIGEYGSIQSNAGSYLTYPGSNIRIVNSSCGILTYLPDGSLQITTASAPCVVYGLLSMELPLQLYGTNVRVGSFTFYLYTDTSTAYIDNVYIYLQHPSSGTPFTMAESNGDYSTSGFYVNFTIYPTAYDLLGPGYGPVTMKFDFILTNNTNIIRFRSVRVGLSHIELTP